MGNLFAGLSSGNTALTYYRRGIETAGHNIANSNVEGFARQRVNVSTGTPINDGGFMVGGGVEVVSITRLRNQFLDAQYRAQLPSLGYWDTRLNCIKNVEIYTGRIDNGTFQTALNNYWGALENLHKYPNLQTSRSIMLSSTESMISSLLGMRSNFDTYRADLNEEIAEMVKEANWLIDEISMVCRDISDALGRGEQPNDLLDRRDLLAERLCKLTGASVGSPTLDERDGDYKIEINGKYLVQGGAMFDCNGRITNVRHLVLVPMVGNSNYYDVQIEYNQYDHVSNYSVANAVIERNATNPLSCPKSEIHELFVERLSNGRTWMVGGARGIIEGGERLDDIYDKNKALGIAGSFSLQVGNAGVKASSNSFINPSNNALNGIVKNAHDPDSDRFDFRIAAGEVETHISFKFRPDIPADPNDPPPLSGTWEIERDGVRLTTMDITTDNGNLMLEDIYTVLNSITDLDVSYDPAKQRLELQAANTENMRGHLLSITDTFGSLTRDLGIANKNPIVEIKVTKEDSLATIANKINGAYMTTIFSSDDPDDCFYVTIPPETAPSKPEEWLHANVVMEPNGSYYIALTSNVSGEANRINVLPGNICDINGDYSTARLLGFVESGVKNGTSYMQFNTDMNAASTIQRIDAHVKDAYFIYNGGHYLSESNTFKDARIFKTTDKLGNLVRWDNPMADELGRFAEGIRLGLVGLNRYYNANGSGLSGNKATEIRINPHLTNGSIFAMLEARDDLALGMIDYLDDMAYELMKGTNAIHYSGHGIGDNELTTGTAFFNHINGRYGASRRLGLNVELSNDLSLIATGMSDGNGDTRGVGDGEVALRMAQLRQTKVFEGGSADFGEYFLLFVGDLGVQGYRADYMFQTQKGVCDQIHTMRDAVMGVSTDEEMLDIIRFQQGVGAIARYMTALDEMLDRVINGMGAR